MIEILTMQKGREQMTYEERFTRLIKELWEISPVFTVLFGLLVTAVTI